MNYQPAPLHMYNNSPEECTPVTPEEIYLKYWRETPDNLVVYPATVTAGEVSWIYEGGLYKAVYGEMLATSEVNNLEEAYAVMEGFFHEFRKHPKQVLIMIKKAKWSLQG